MDKVIGAIFASIFVFFGVFILGIIFSLLAAIPLYFLWNFLAPTYFSFLPPVWLAVPFWHVFLLMWCLSLVRNIIMPSATATAKASAD